MSHAGPYVQGFRVVQPWGRNPALESTLISHHDSAMAAFAAIDELRFRIRRTGGSSKGIDLVVVGPDGLAVERPNTR